MAPILYKSSAPATMMLFGEHAVLDNKRAVVCAINKRIKVILTPRNDYKINIESTLGNITINLEHFTIASPFEFVLTAIHHVKKQLPSGFELKIESDFGDKEGLGSSAAVTVATVAVLLKYINDDGPTIPQDVFELALSVIRSVQGLASGADVAASVFGGILVYQQTDPYILAQLNQTPPLVAVYSGYKTKTKEVIQKVLQKKEHHTLVFEKLYNTIDACTEEAIKAIQTENWVKLGELMSLAQGLMVSLSVSTPLLNQLIDALTSQETIHGAKISGSGLGDCVIGVGNLTSPLFQNEDSGVRQIPIQVSERGLCFG